MRSPTQSTVCRLRSASCCSKLNIALPVAVRPVEEVGDVAADRDMERREAGVIAGAAQILDLALGEILIAVTDCRGHVDIFDMRRLAERREHRGDHLAEAL